MPHIAPYIVTLTNEKGTQNKVRFRVSSAIDAETEEKVHILEARPEQHTRYGWLFINNYMFQFPTDFAAEDFLLPLIRTFDKNQYHMTMTDNDHFILSVPLENPRVIPVLMENPRVIPVLKNVPVNERAVFETCAINQTPEPTPENTESIQQLIKIGLLEDHDGTYIVPIWAHMAWCQLCSDEVEEDV